MKNGSKMKIEEVSEQSDQVARKPDF